MEFLEKDLEDIIFESNDLMLMERGLFLSGRRYRQMRIGNYGVSDIITWRRNRNNHRITIYELKKGPLSKEHYDQVVRYMKGVSRYMTIRGIPSWRVHITGVLIGKDISNSHSLLYLSELIDSEYYGFEQYTYRYELDGLKFSEHSGYKLIDEGFNISKPEL